MVDEGGLVSRVVCIHLYFAAVEGAKKETKEILANATVSDSFTFSWLYYRACV